MSNAPCAEAAERLAVARFAGTALSDIFAASVRVMGQFRLSVSNVRKQMQRVADAMQAGDEDRAAREVRIAVRLAKLTLA